MAMSAMAERKMGVVETALILFIAVNSVLGVSSLVARHWR